MSNMKALVSDGKKSASVQSVAIPSPGEGEILVKIHYIAQNPTDWKAMSAAPSGRIIGCDFAGTVEDPNGSHWRKGQRVAGFVQGTSDNPLRGVFAEYALIEASLVFEIPESVSYQQAAVIPLAFATASQALFQRLRVSEPSKPAKSAYPILINGGTSSVGKYAIQLCKLAGLFVVATGSKRNHSLLTGELGADAAVDYNDADWPEQVRKLTHDNLEHAFDCIGATKLIAQALSTHKGGHIVAILPIAPEVRKDIDDNVNKKVKTESTIVYTVFERTLKYGAFENCGEPTPEDKAHWEKFLSMLPEMLTGGKIQPNRIREMGGIDDILKGFQEQADGKVSAEKLVYKIA